MVTSPTILAGTHSADPIGPSSKEVQATERFSVFRWAIALVLVVVASSVGAGGIVYYLARSGHLPISHISSPKAESSIALATHAMVLEPLLVNLADSGGNSYLKISMTLRVLDTVERGGQKEREQTTEGKGATVAMAAVRDTTLTVLGKQTSDGLLAPDGKEHLRTALRAAFAEHNADLKVMDIYFTDFLVQH
jgi:flagellar FliL protein